MKHKRLSTYVGRMKGICETVYMPIIARRAKIYQYANITCGIPTSYSLWGYINFCMCAALCYLIKASGGRIWKIPFCFFPLAVHCVRKVTPATFPHSKIVARVYLQILWNVMFVMFAVAATQKKARCDAVRRTSACRNRKRTLHESDVEKQKRVLEVRLGPAAL